MLLNGGAMVEWGGEIFGRTDEKAICEGMAGMVAL
jgi:hypothetical protein